MVVFGDLDMTVLDGCRRSRAGDDRLGARRRAGAGVWDRVRTEVRGRAPGVRRLPPGRGIERVGGCAGPRSTSASGCRPTCSRTSVSGCARPDPRRAPRTRWPLPRRRVEVLVARLVEVGLTSPHETVIGLLDADRFGIAQLHQLRGRVGRARTESWCYLLGAGSTAESGEAASRRWARPRTDSSWPRWTSAYAARGRSSTPVS